MMLRTRTLAIVSVGAILHIAVSPMAPAQAASLIYTDDASKLSLFNFNFGQGGTGTLTFRGVLTEPGIVTTSYSEIRASAIAPFFDFFYRAVPPVAFPNPREIIFSFNPDQDATFTFDQGNLVGIFYNSESQPFQFSDIRFCGPSGGCIIGTGLMSLFLQGNRYRDFASIKGTNFNRYGQVVDTFEVSGSVTSGSIGISNVYSVEAVPEPATILGTGLGLALGVALRKKFKAKE